MARLPVVVADPAHGACLDGGEARHGQPHPPQRYRLERRCPVGRPGGCFRAWRALSPSLCRKRWMLLCGSVLSGKVAGSPRIPQGHVPLVPRPVTGCSLDVASAGAAPAAAALSTAIRRAGWAGMCLARAPKRSVLSVSWASTAALDTHRMSTVWLPGPSTSCSSRVSLLDLCVARARGARVGVGSSPQRGVPGLKV